MNFKNLPEPKNNDNDKDYSLGIDYSGNCYSLLLILFHEIILILYINFLLIESIKIDFTKLNIKGICICILIIFNVLFINFNTSIINFYLY